MLRLVLPLLIAFAFAAQGQISESIEVRVANIDVVVTDASGKRVTGLGRDDFEILEDERAQTITNFYEVRDGEATSSGGSSESVPAPPRRFIIFVDSDSIHPYNRKLLMSSLHKFVAGHVRQHDLVSVVSWNRTLNVLAAPTGDKKVLRAAIDKLAGEGSSSSIFTDVARLQKQCVSVLAQARNGAIPPLVAYEDCINIIRGEMMTIALVSRQLLNALEGSMSMLAGSEGKKVLVLAGARLPRSPGVEIYQWANMLFQPYLGGFDWPSRRPDQDDEQLDYLQKAAFAANRSGVTLYTIAAVTSTDTTHAGYRTPVDDHGADFFSQTNTFDAFGTLSRMTGGLSINRPSDYDAAFASIAEESGAYYSLGYRPREMTGNDRKIVVRTKNRDLTVRARETYALKTADDVMTDRVIGNIFVPVAPSSWKIAVATEKPARSGKNFSVPFEVTIPAEITLLPGDSALSGGYTVYVAVGTAQGALSSVFRQPDTIRITPSEEAAFRRAPLTFGATLTVRPGENILSIGVVDHMSGATAFARTTIVAR